MAITEYLLETDKFKRPKIVKDKDAIYILLVRLALLEKNTYQTKPDMGLGLRSRYRYSYAEDVGKLISDYEDQINTYLPAFRGVKVNATVKEHTLFIEVTIGDTVYPIYFNTETKTLEDFM